MTDRPTQHECTWQEMTESSKEKMRAKQEDFKWAFYDAETEQCYMDEKGERKWLTEHYCTNIILVKVWVVSLSIPRL